MSDLAMPEHLMYDQQTCNECKDLLLKPEYQEAFSAGGGKRLQYRRSLAGLKAKSKIGCLFCRKLYKLFQRINIASDGADSSLSEDLQDEVVFGMGSFELNTLIFLFHVETGTKTLSETNGQAFQLLTTSGIDYDNPLTCKVGLKAKPPQMILPPSIQKADLSVTILIRSAASILQSSGCVTARPITPIVQKRRNW
jgi:hypothetical protein